MKKVLSLIISLAILLTVVCESTAVFAMESTQNNENQLLMGDANLSGQVEIIDATFIQRHLALLITLSQKAMLAADVDGDDNVTIIDATNIQRYLAKFTNTGKVGEYIDLIPEQPTQAPTEAVTQEPTQEPTEDVTQAPTQEPTQAESVVAAKIIYSDNQITLKDANSNTVSTASNVVVSGTYAEIIAPDSVEVSGSCNNGQLSVNIDKEQYVAQASAVEVTLNGLTLSNSSDSPIFVKSVDDYCTLSVKKGSVNTISDGTSYLNSDEDAAAIYSKDDLKIKGKGTLNVNGNCAYGICSKDDLKLWNGTINVVSKGTGIKGKDSVRIGDPDDIGISGAYDGIVINIESGEDGIRSNNATDEGKGAININGGTITINSQQDGIQAEQSLNINGGTINIKTYKGSAYSAPTNSTAKGIKSEGLLNLNGGTVTIDSSDDCIHCGNELTIGGGTYTLSSGDDGIHSDNKVTVNGGDVTITKSYEGLEGYYIYINDGKLNLKASDDGINAAGGNDGSSRHFQQAVLVPVRCRQARQRAICT